MTLQKQNIPLSLNQGVNTKFDPKQLPFGSFTNVENIVFDKEHEFNKRHGYDKLSATGIADAAIQSVIGVTKFKEQPLWISRDQIYSYSDGAEAWQSEGSYDSIVPESKAIVQNGKEQSAVQCEVFQNYQVFSWIEGGQVRISALDTETKGYIFYNQLLPTISSTTTNITRPRIEVLKQGVFFFYAGKGDGTAAASLNYTRFDLNSYVREGIPFDATASGAFTAEAELATLSTSVNSNMLYDVASVEDRGIMIGYHDSGTNDLLVRKIKDDSTLSTSIFDPFNSGTLSYIPMNAVDLRLDPYTKLITVTMIDEGDNVKLGIITADGLSFRDITLIEDCSSVGPITNAGGARNVTTVTKDGEIYHIFYQVYETYPYEFNISTGTSATASSTIGAAYTWNQSFIRKNTYTRITSTVGTASDVARGVGLASKAFVQDENIYLNTVRESQLDAAYYVMKSDGAIQAKISQGLAGPLLGTERTRGGDATVYYNYDASTNPNAVYRIASLSQVPPLTTEKFLFVSSIQGKIVSGLTGATSFFSLYGVNSSILDFSNSITNQTEELGGNLHFAGGQLKSYDGNVLVEENFNYPPAALIKVNGTTGGTVFPNDVSLDNYWYWKAIYTWTDAQGNIHRSGVSQQVELKIPSSTGATGLNYVDIRIPALSLTQKIDPYIELYRTAVNGSVFYRVNGDSFATSGASQTFDPIANTSSVDLLVFRDDSTDAQITANEILYTTGGILENLSPPSCSVVASFKNRLFLAGLENKLELRYSKLLSENIAIELNDTLSILSSQVGGDIIALKGMDDKLIIFKESAIFYLSGEGPNNLGEQDSFIEPQLISSDVGCSVRDTVVLTPQGIFFKSSKGIYLLSRSIGLTYVGAPVEDYNSLTFTKGELVAKDNEVRFLTSDGVCLVYNYYRDRWALFSNHRGEGSIVINNIYHYVHKEGPNNFLYKQSYDKYTDDNTPIEMTVETGWMNPVAAQNAIRVYRMLLLGRYYSPHKLKISVAYNYDDNYVETSLINVLSYTDVYEFGSPGVDAISTGLTEGYYGDPGGTTGDYTTAIAYGGKDLMQYQIRVNFKQQKCEAMKLKIETLQVAGQLGRGVDLSQLLFVAGFRGTEYKIKQSRVFTTGTNA